ncbi:MAG TPA: HoxN/HupN/NixA family nickel/cobalt transporter [Ktedonobacterales bacterium]|jgi:high-affinity nickel-transport protein
MLANFRRVLSDETPGLRAKVIGIYAALIAVNIALWVITLLSSITYPLLLPVAAAAYGFGLRHAVDADHISAIDNVTRKLMQEKKKPVAVGFFFSLGHSSVVFIMAALIAAGSAYVSGNLANDDSPLKTYGGLIGTSVSALFLFAIAVINIIILAQIFQTFRSVTRGSSYSEEDVDEYLNKRGFFARIFRPVFKTIDKSWKMYPVGFLFGLGFDTATEIALLASAGAFATQHVPFYIVLLLPLLFTAGMSLADTTDGVLMLGAYGWAFVKPIRKLFYNMSITLISVLVALVVGALETLSIISGQLSLSGGFWDFVSDLDDNFGTVGAAIIVIFLVSWGISTIIYRVKKYDDLEVIRTAAPTAAGD